MYDADEGSGARTKRQETWVCYKSLRNVISSFIRREKPAYFQYVLVSAGGDSHGKWNRHAGFIIRCLACPLIYVILKKSINVLRRVVKTGFSRLLQFYLGHVRCDIVSKFSFKQFLLRKFRK